MKVDLNTIDSFVDSLSSKLLLDNNNTDNKDIKTKEYYQLLSLIFENENGRKLLNIWEKEYFYSPSFENNIKEHIYIREGENRFLRKILTDLEYHKLLIKEGK